MRIIGEHRRDVKEEDPTNERQENPPQRRRCWDWMIVSGDCHYARDRSAFKTYRHVGKTIQGNAMILNQNIFVAGIGTVELRVRTGNEEGSPDGMLVLENVLHIPRALCNGFNWLEHQRMTAGGIRIGLETKGIDRDGRPSWCSQPFVGFSKLALAGNPQGDSYLHEGGHYSLSIYISDEDLGFVLAGCEPE
jgi:Pol polyprotein